MFIDRLLSPWRSRQRSADWARARDHAFPEAIQDYLDAEPDLDQRVDSLKALALDFETDGLEPCKHRILSAGWVQVDGMVIRGNTAAHRLVRIDGASVGGATVHGLRDMDLKDGEALETILLDLFKALKGRVMIAHHAIIEQSFVAQAATNLWGAAPPLIAIDTMILEQRRRQIHGRTAGSLRLMDLRENYALPAYANHHALGDAHACAELYLALVAYSGLQKERAETIITPSGPPRLRA